MTNEDHTISTRDIIRAGFEEIGRTKQLLATLHEERFTSEQLRTLLDDVSCANDPDVALNNLVDIIRENDDLGVLLPNETAWHNLICVLGASDALGKLMRARPQLVYACACDPHHMSQCDRRLRIDTILACVGADTQSHTPVASLDLAEATNRLRANYREQLAAIMARDVTAGDPIEIQPQISAALSDLADAALQGALAIARHEIDESDRVRFSIIGMGKLGAQELNYVSDVDLIYVVEPDDEDLDSMALTRIGTKMATLMQRVCMSVIAGVSEPILWPIDGGLRPEGKDGPLVRRLESHRAYYEQWAQNWEFQALLKARPVAGDEALGQEYMDMTRPFVWNAAKRDNFVLDCQNMRERVESLIPAALQDREIKLGCGGLRDVEFTVQMLQLVHGRSDETLRTRATLPALRALSDGGYVSRVQARELSHDYRFERVMEHRQQMWALKRTHLFPDLGAGSIGGITKKRDTSVDELNRNRELRRLARAFHMHPEQLVEAYDETRRNVRHLHMDIYYRPMLPFNATSGENEYVSLSDQAMFDRYESIGFADPQAAQRHIIALTDGVTRASKINRILLPAVLHWLGQGQAPDMGLLFWRTLEERFGSEHEYLGFLRDSPSAAQRLCHVLSNSRFLGDALNKSLESITWLGNDALLQPRAKDSVVTQCEAIINRHAGQLQECATMLRTVRRHEIERIGLGWMNDVVNERDMLTGMTYVYDAVIDAALTWAMRDECNTLGVDDYPAHITVIAMGRYGGCEVNFSSDADVIIVYRPTPGTDDTTAHSFAKKTVEKLRAIIQGPSSIEPKIELDMDLRPEGKNGPLVRSYESCKEYYQSWSSTWERQALLRARCAAGDANLGRDFIEHIANPLRYAIESLSDEELGEIRRLKARMEAERLPRGVRKDQHVKLGRGGLSDVEWTIQLLQLQHAGHHAQLQVHSTLHALDALEQLNLIGETDAKILRATWQMCTDARNGNYLWSGRANRADILPNDMFSLGGIAVYLGYDANHGQRFLNDIHALMRKCREVTDRLFYGIVEQS